LALRTLLARQALCALALFMTSCGDDSGTPGDIDNVTFGYRCLSVRDPICEDDPNVENAPLKAMPNIVAVGSSFGVAFKSVSEAAQDGSAVVSAASSALLVNASSFPGAFTAVKPGFVALLARRGSTIVDVFHVRLVDVDYVRVDASFQSSGAVIQGASTIELSVGELATLSTVAKSETNEVLAGSPNDIWTSDDAAVAEILPSDGVDGITVRGNAVGETSIHVSLAGASAAILVKILDASTGSGGSGGSGGEGGAGGEGGGS
jgi:hypothetical protein